MNGPDDVRDPEIRLAFAYAPSGRRAALAALWALDGRLAAMALAAREPMLAQIRLAWWRDALYALGRGGAAPADPLLRSLGDGLAPLLAPGALAPVAAGWSALLDAAEPDAALIGEHARLRGAALFEAAATVLGAPGWPELARGGRLWALVDLARRGIGHDGPLAMARAELGGGGSARWPPALRPLGMLVALAVRDARAGRTAAQGAPARLLQMLRHRLTGSVGLGGEGAPR